MQCLTRTSSDIDRSGKLDSIEHLCRHHSSVSSWQASREADCPICEPFWNQIPSEAQRDIEGRSNEWALTTITFQRNGEEKFILGHVDAVGGSRRRFLFDPDNGKKKKSGLMACETFTYEDLSSQEELFEVVPWSKHS